MIAAYHGDIGELQVLVSQPGIAINRATSWHFDREFFTPPLEGERPPLRYGSRTALMYAALGGSVGATELLLHHGAYAHERDAEGWQAAEFARNDGVVAALSAH